jgi:hypothetical protein
MGKDSQEISLFGNKSDALPAHLQNDRGLGNENAGDALAVPQIKLLQALSPEMRNVDGAQVGMLYNNVTGALYSSIYVANVYLDHYFTVWKDRKKGGGKFGEFADEASAISHIATLDGNPQDYQAQETHKHSLILLDESGEVTGPAVMYMKGTQLTPSRAWNTEIVQTKAARFATIWTLSTKMDRNNRGDEYANYTVTQAGWAPEGLYEELKIIYSSLSSKRPQQAEAA